MTQMICAIILGFAAAGALLARPAAYQGVLPVFVKPGACLMFKDANEMVKVEELSAYWIRVRLLGEPPEPNKVRWLNLAQVHSLGVLPDRLWQLTPLGVRGEPLARGPSFGAPGPTAANKLEVPNDAFACVTNYAALTSGEGSVEARLRRTNGPLSCCATRPRDQLTEDRLPSPATFSRFLRYPA